MNTTPIYREASRPTWSFADLASTYRFWALIISTVAVAFGGMIFRQILSLQIQQSQLPMSGQSIYIYCLIIGHLASIPLGLLLARSKTVGGLLTALVVCALSYAIIAVYNNAPRWEYIYVVTFTSIAVVYAVPFAVLVYISGSAAGRMAFASALAIVMTWAEMNSLFSSMLALMIMDKYGIMRGSLVSLATLGIAILFLLPIRGTLFAAAPPLRHRPLSPRIRSGATVAVVTALPWIAASVLTWLLSTRPLPMDIQGWCIIAGITIAVGLIATTYWLCRLYGETASLHRSPKLFTPRATLLMILLVPMAIPILLLCLGNVLREAESVWGYQPRSSWWFNICSVAFPPIALAIAQERLNDLASRPNNAGFPPDNPGAD
ncbi:hypothetical protein I5T97_18260 [Serratia marcescens]|nr:hypothetical protein [Serratia marcescens]